MLQLPCWGIAKATVPCVLANITPGDWISSLTIEAGVSVGLHHCKERAVAWRTELEINLSDKIMLCLEPLHHPFETNLYAPNLSPKGKFLLRSVLVLCVDKSLLDHLYFADMPGV